MKTRTIFPLIMQDGGDTGTVENVLVSTATSFSVTTDMLGKIVEVTNSAPITITLDNIAKNGLVTFILRTTNAITFAAASGVIKSDNGKVKLNKQHCSVTVWFDGTNYSLIGKLST